MIPSFQDYMLPILKFASDNNEQSANEVKEKLAKQFNLSKGDKDLMCSGGGHTIFANRVDWALTYLRQTGLIKKTRRGFYKITAIGHRALKQDPKRVDLKFLKQ